MNLDLQLQRVLDRVELVAGLGDPHQGRMCVMALAAFLAGEIHTDGPRSASPLIRAFAIQVNDGMPTSVRRRLKPFAPRIVGTNDGLDGARAEVLRRALADEILPRASGHSRVALAAERRRGTPGRLRTWLRGGERGLRIREILARLDKPHCPGCEVQLAGAAGRLVSVCARDAPDAEAEWYWNQAVGLLDGLCDVGAEGRCAPEVPVDRLRRLDQALAERAGAAASAVASAATWPILAAAPGLADGND